MNGKYFLFRMTKSQKDLTKRKEYLKVEAESLLKLTSTDNNWGLPEFG